MPATGSEVATAGPDPGRRRFRLSLRLRLTLLYGGCFLVAGAAVLAITYALVAHDTVAQKQSFVIRNAKLHIPGPVAAFTYSGALPPTVPKGTITQIGGAVAQVRTSGGAGSQATAAPGPLGGALVRQLTKADQKTLNQLVRRANVDLSLQRTQSLSSLLTWSGIALAIMAMLSIGLGWLVAGRGLRPLRTMNLRARAITEENLHERLGFDDRADELGELAGTFNGLLARLERAFDSQRRFVANASHELRTPITLERALIEVALADPDASVESLRVCCERVLAAGERQERLIESLLTLARSQGAITAGQTVDLAELAEELVMARAADADGILVETALDRAPAGGDVALIERLVANLVDNAIAYNLPEGGWIRIATQTLPGGSELRIANSGGLVPGEQVAELFEPFRRLDGERTANGHGAGLGLSIVRAIATAHGATLEARPLEPGGLELTVRFPPAPDRVAGAVVAAV